MFKELKVLELASVLAGPSVGQFFAELGADVIKVENLKTGGDVTRSWKGNGEETDDRSAYFCSVNSGKRSIAVDLHSIDGKRVVHALAKKSDIVIASYKPGDAEKLGVDYTTLSLLNPQLIYGQVTGYGANDPRVGYDAVIQAEAGFMFMNGEAGGPSLKMPVALIDVLAAHQLKEGILVSLLKKMKSNEGSFVEVSLFHTAISSLVNQASNWLVAKKLPGKQGSAHPNIAPYGDTFLTRDGKELLLAVGNDKQFLDLCAALQADDLAEDPRFLTNPERVRNRFALHEILQNRIRTFESVGLVSKLQEALIPAGLIRNLQQVFGEHSARQVIMEDSSGLLSGLRTFVCEPFLSSQITLLPPPHFGEHTESILAGLEGR